MIINYINYFSYFIPMEMIDIIALQSPGAPPKRVAWCSPKEIAQAVCNGSSFADWNYRQFSSPEDTFNGDDIDNWFLFLVVKLI
jgi:hypothetical protein